MKNRFIFILLFLFFCTYFADSQTIGELETQRKRAQEKLAVTQKLLDENQKSKIGTEYQISLLVRSIQQTDALILTINSEIDGLNRNISSLKNEKKVLSAHLEIAKKQYAKLVAKNEIFRKQFSPALYVLSSKSFIQAYRRMRYLNEMAEYRKNQALEIKDLTKNIEEKENLLLSYVAKKEQSLSDKEQQNQKLNQKKTHQNKILNDFSKKEKELKRTIAQEQETQKKLNRLIQQKVAEENRKKAERAKKAEAEKKKRDETEKKNTESSITENADYKEFKSDQILNGNFEKNRGNLPMPVEQGKVHRRYGRQTNPYTKAIEDNYGIYMLAPANSDARAIFDGTVFDVQYEPGSGYVVWVMHGNYSSVYAQLSLFYVKKGEKIKAKQSIGKIAVKNSNTELSFFILNKNAAYENPENWLNK
jgi:septal ring factor EnvC (AmiA/AmiB activator)